MASLPELDAEVARESARCLSLLDEVYKPRSGEDGAAVAELRASGVSEAKIRILYPLTGEDYIKYASLSFPNLSAAEMDRLADGLLELSFSVVVGSRLKTQHRSKSLPDLARLADFCLLMREHRLSQVLTKSSSGAGTRWEAVEISSGLTRMCAVLEEVRQLQLNRVATEVSAK